MISDAQGSAIRIPTATDRTFIPYPVGLDDDFEACLPDTEKEEGVTWLSGPMPDAAYSNDAHDPGGKTGEGIIQKEYDLKRRQWGLPTRWVHKMSKDEERTIYYTDYWLPWCPKMPVGLKLCMFDTSVNNGAHAAMTILQKTLSTTPDGVWGNDTQLKFDQLLVQWQAALDGHPTYVTPTYYINRFCDFRLMLYRSRSIWKYFHTGWTRRNDEIHTWALEQVKNATAKPTPEGSTPVV